MFIYASIGIPWGIGAGWEVVFLTCTLADSHGVLADPETASSYASTVARGFERIGLDHLEIAAPVIARARSGAQRLSIQIRGRREKIKKAAFPIEMLKSWYDDVDEELVAGTLQGTILTMIQYAAQVGPRRSEYTEGDIKFDPKTDLTRANINYYLRDEEGNETKLEPTPEGIREFLSTTDQNTSRAGIRPPLMKNDQFGKRMGRWETPIPLNSEWLCAALDCKDGTGGSGARRRPRWDGRIS